MATDGFVRLPNWLLDDGDLNLHELAVYIVLLRFRNPKTGKCFPGMTTIADRARISRRSVIRAIADLEARGIIRVERRSTLQVNQSNVYEVAVADETPQYIWANSSRGQRIPSRRRPSDSESLGPTFSPDPSDSESPPSDSGALPSDSPSPPPVTPSHPKKIQTTRSTNENHEQASRRTLPSAREFSFDAVQKITDKQFNYLNDLHIFLTERRPEKRTSDKWADLDTTEASTLIDTYWKQMDRGRGGMWDSTVDEDHPLYPHLSEHGHRWIANGCLPDSAYDYAA